jgi:hypothetical protein
MVYKSYRKSWGDESLAKAARKRENRRAIGSRLMNATSA